MQAQNGMGYFGVVKISSSWIVSFFCFLFISNYAIAQEKEMVGYLEKVKIYPEDILLHGKLDTGADISSLNAEDIVEYRKTGKKWVRFTVRNRFGEQVRVEREVKCMVSIKQHNSSLPAQKRYVVRLGICLGSAYMEEEVSLVNRANFTSQMLVGRSFQAGNVIIDPAQTYLVEPNCQEFLTAEADSKKQIKKKKSKKIEEQAAAEGQVVEEKVISEEIQ